MSDEPQVAVVGESIIDLIRQPSGDFRPYLGGSPYNVARAMARQDTRVTYLSPLSSDSFGDALHEALLAEGAHVPPWPRSDRPTALALVTIDEHGQPSYGLYREGIADRDVSARALVDRLPDSVEVLHTGSLALVPGDTAKMRTVLEAARARGVIVAVDVNLRPAAEPDRDAYVRGVLELLPLCDIVKASDEDLREMGLGEDPRAAAQQVLGLLDHGLVALTRGAEGAALLNDQGTIERPAWPVATVVDTVGSGDCFQASLLAALLRSGQLDGRAFASAAPDALIDALDHARVAAALNVTRAGASPPTWDEVIAARDG
ncbi:MAG: carbohydrate kinase [Myxococcota bacterium]